MKVNLFISHYTDNNPARQRELSNTLISNIRNELIDRVVLISESFIETEKEGKIIKYPQSKRPTYNDFFELTKQFQNDINIISNSDIIFTKEAITLLKRHNWRQNEMFALTRWENSRHFYGHDFSQDCWIKKGRIDMIQGADFCLGIPGCDGRIAHLLSKHYVLRNPSLTIKIFHNHTSNLRNYSGLSTLPKPFLCIKPTRL
jgi:hypothetical protein